MHVACLKPDPKRTSCAPDLQTSLMIVTCRMKTAIIRDVLLLNIERGVEWTRCWSVDSKQLAILRRLLLERQRPSSAGLFNRQGFDSVAVRSAPKQSGCCVESRSAVE